MEFINVNYSLNQTYFVEKQVFESMVKQAAENTKTIKLVDSKVELLNSRIDYLVEVKVLIKKTASYNESLSEFQTEIEKYSKNIKGSKPGNITFVVEGEF